MLLILKQLFCKHEYKFVRNVYGDEIYLTGKWKRSWWKCKKCGLDRSETFLVDEGVQTQNLKRFF